MIHTMFPTAPSTKVLPLSSFVKEILIRAQTTFSTLQLALLYLLRVRLALAEHRRPVCARRMFLGCLIVAYKYLQDRTYSNVAWSRITGLSVLEITAVEAEVLGYIDYRLTVSEETFKRWSLLIVAEAAKISHTREMVVDTSVANTRSQLHRIPSPDVQKSPQQRPHQDNIHSSNHQNSQFSDQGNYHEPTSLSAPSTAGRHPVAAAHLYPSPLTRFNL